MSLLTVTGVVKDDAKIVGTGSKFLAVTLIEYQAGFGKAANRVFKNYFKVIAFGQGLEDLAAKLTKGTLAEAAGDAQCEVYQPRGGAEWKGVLKIVGRVKPVLMSESAAPAAASDSGASDDPPY